MYFLPFGQSINILNPFVSFFGKYGLIFHIGVAPITHLHTCIIKIATFKGGHPMWYTVGSKFFPLREVLILKREANEENLC